MNGLGDIPLGELPGGFVIGFGGGSMFLECKKCSRHISAREIPFPGTKEAQKPICEHFVKVASVHSCSVNP